MEPVHLRVSSLHVGTHGNRVHHDDLKRARPHVDRVSSTHLRSFTRVVGSRRLWGGRTDDLRYGIQCDYCRALAITQIVSISVVMSVQGIGRYAPVPPVARRAERCANGVTRFRFPLLDLRCLLITETIGSTVRLAFPYKCNNPQS